MLRHSKVALHGAGHTALVVCSAYLLQVALSEITNRSTICSACDALAGTNEGIVALLLPFCGRDSDAWHSSYDMVLLDSLAHRLLELVKMLVASLVKDLTHAILALFERLHCLGLVGEFFATAAHTSTRKVNLSEGLLSLWVLLRVNLLQYLQIGQSSDLFLSVRQLASVAIVCLAAEVTRSICFGCHFISNSSVPLLQAI